MSTGNRVNAGGKTGGVAGPGLPPPPASVFAQELQKKAAGKSPADIRAVCDALTSETSLLQINTAQEYADLPPDKLALHAILGRLSRNAAPGAAEVFGSLSASPPFLAEQSRVESLLLTLPKVRPLPPAALPLLQKLVSPDSENLEMAVRALFEIGEKSALDLFAAEMLGGKHDLVLVQGWMRDPLLRRRREPVVLQMSLDLLRQPKLDAEIKNALVEALYDYRPDEWYSREVPPPKPPAGKKLPAGTLELLKKIAGVVAADPDISATNKALAAK